MNTKKYLKKMTIEDKARLLCGTGAFWIGGIQGWPRSGTQHAGRRHGT